MSLEIASSTQFDELVYRLTTLLGTKEVNELSEQEFRKLLRAKPLFVRAGTSINMAVYRARRPRADESLSVLKTFGHPASQQCVSAGRCHLLRKPVFYGASDQDTAIKEAIQTTGREADGSLVYLSKWQPCRPLNYLDFIYPQTILQSDIARSLSNHSRMQLNSNLSMYEGDNVKALPRIAEKIGRAFLSTSHSMSSRICHSILYAQGNHLREKLPVHGVLYPSVVKNHTGFNFAIAPFAIRKHFTPVGIWQVKINRNEANGVYLSYLHFGIPDRSGHVAWYKMEPTTHFDWIRGVGIMSSTHIPIEVSLDATITMDQDEMRIGDFIKLRHWKSLQQEVGKLGTVTEDLLPGTQIVRPKYIRLEKPALVKTHEGELTAISIMILMVIQTEFSLVEPSALSGV